MTVRVLHGDCRDVLRTLPDASVQCCVTSPPYYGLRDYGIAGQIGLEPSPDEYVAQMVAVFREVRRVLRDDGTCWLNLGDSYAGGTVGRNDMDDATLARRAEQYGTGRGSGAGPRGKSSQRPIPAGAKPKDLLLIPHRVALALQADGWWLRSAVVWHKPNPMPESVTDRPTSSYEMVFLLTKSATYFYDADAVREEYAPSSASRYGYEFRADVPSALNNKSPSLGAGKIAQNPAGRNLRNVWTIATCPTPFAHFATMPPELAERCIKAGTRAGDTVLDPFFGAGTTALAASRLQRHCIGIELNPDYISIGERRITGDAPLFAEVAA